MLAWLSVWSEEQTCIWPSWCHCHSLSLASVKSRLVLPLWYRLTRVVLGKGPLNGVCVCNVSHTYSWRAFSKCPLIFLWWEQKHHSETTIPCLAAYFRGQHSETKKRKKRHFPDTRQNRWSAILHIFLDWVKNHQQIISVTSVHSETVCSSLHCSSAAVEHGWLKIW